MDIEQIWRNAKANDAIAQYSLGMQYLRGEDTVCDKKLAFIWVAVAVMNGHRGAELTLAEMYYNGDGIDCNLALAESLYVKMALRGDKDMRMYLAKRYAEGVGIFDNPTQGYAWYISSQGRSPVIKQKLLSRLTEVQINNIEKENYTCDLSEDKACFDLLKSDLYRHFYNQDLNVSQDRLETILLSKKCYCPFLDNNLKIPTHLSNSIEQWIQIYKKKLPVIELLETYDFVRAEIVAKEKNIPEQEYLDEKAYYEKQFIDSIIIGYLEQNQFQTIRNECSKHIESFTTSNKRYFLQEKEKYVLKYLERLLFKNDFDLADEVAKKEDVFCERYLEIRRKYEKILEQKHKEDARKKLSNIINTDYLNAKQEWNSKYFQYVTEDEFNKLITDRVLQWASNCGGPELDFEQASATAQIWDDIQVIARAGSGKTTTLVNRALFLHQCCGIAPNQMLLVAFNRKAALEIRKRILCSLNSEADESIKDEIEQRRKNNPRADRQQIEIDSVCSVAERLGVALPYVMTFHALAYAVVHPEEGILYDDSKSQSKTLSRAVQQVIDDHLQIPEYGSQIREVMLAHFREAWDRIIEGGYDLNQEELLRFRRSLPRESMNGEYVKSFGEKVIADFLLEHNIPYKYERNHRWGGINYRPDFTIFKTPESGLIIEYFGLEGDPDYDEMSEEKRRYWATKHNWTLLEFNPRDISNSGVNHFRDILKAKLEKHEISCNRLSEEEIWERVRDRSIDRFSRAMVNFIGRCRKQWLTPGELDATIKSHSSLSNAEHMFLNIAHVIFQAYLNRLNETGEEDFDGLMQRAAENIQNGTTIFERKSCQGDINKLRYVFIDEYQDFSKLFYSLVAEIRKINSKIKFFCVGDDWQAINGFAGSDLKYFQDFKSYFPDSRSLYISTNYRSQKLIVETGNALMIGLGKPAKANTNSPGHVLVSNLSKFEPTDQEKHRHPGDEITPAVLRLTGQAISEGHKVVLLSRRNGLPWYVNYTESENSTDVILESFVKQIRSFFPQGDRNKVAVSTTHTYKGLEKAVVIILDGVERSYPLIHPDWVFCRVLGESLQKITDEERRLFYVALTRAIKKLIIVTESKSESPFINDIKSQISLPELIWDDYPPVFGQKERVIIKVGDQDHKRSGGTYFIKDQLKACGYRWQSTGWKCWIKSFQMNGFDERVWQNETWAAAADGIEVRVIDENETILETYHAGSGQWAMVRH